MARIAFHNRVQLFQHNMSGFSHPGPAMPPVLDSQAIQAALGRNADIIMKWVTLNSNRASGIKQPGLDEMEAKLRAELTTGVTFLAALGDRNNQVVHVDKEKLNKVFPQQHVPPTMRATVVPPPADIRHPYHPQMSQPLAASYAAAPQVPHHQGRPMQTSNAPPRPVQHAPPSALIDDDDDSGDDAGAMHDDDDEDYAG